MITQDQFIKNEMRLNMVDDRRAVLDFADHMAAKMHLSTAMGRLGWQACPPQDLKRMLLEHVEKGDVIDIANFCMMLFQIGHQYLNDIE